MVPDKHFKRLPCQIQIVRVTERAAPNREPVSTPFGREFSLSHFPVEGDDSRPIVVERDLAFEVAWIERVDKHHVSVTNRK